MRSWLFPYSRALLLITLLISSTAGAQQIDIHGPAGSVAFGFNVIVLPNGNILVTDPSAVVSGMTLAGAVYLYAPDGSLISTLVGGSTGDSIGAAVGRARITVLTNGNFVVPSPYWNGNGSSAGAVTFGDANTGWGVGGTVTVGGGNSLVGSQASDMVGYDGITALSDGNYVVASSNWANGGTTGVGAVTWASGSGGATGGVSIFNSLIGNAANDHVGVGGVTALANGHYVVASGLWNNNTGAATWVSGGGPTSDSVSSLNSLIGSNANDYAAGAITLLKNGNYVVSSSNWNGGAGAATWCNGSNGQPIGAISASNSLVGSAAGDAVSYDGITALTNGNYVVPSEYWNNSTGAVTWGNGAGGTVGAVTANPSIIGAAAGDAVGYGAIVALTNGNYAVGSFSFSGGRGAVTWGNGASGTNLTVSSGNSLVGSAVTDSVGYTITALTNGNYVSSASSWNGNKGAVTWGNGTNGNPKGAISAANSLVGSTANDYIGYTVTALTNGNYVTYSSSWNGGVGAVTWGNGSTGTVGAVGAGNSLVGSTTSDFVGTDVVALSNGNYVAGSFGWDNGVATNAGAFTWGNGKLGTKGVVSTSNSVYGQLINDGVSNFGFKAFANGTCAVLSASWNDDGTFQGGAVTLVRGNTPYPGPITSKNSVLGKFTNGGSNMTFDYNPAHDQLVVGRRSEAIVSLFRADELSRGDFEAH
jgi:hypothetical protein